MEFAATASGAQASRPLMTPPPGRCVRAGGFFVVRDPWREVEAMGWIYVAVGGALGALLRFGISGWVQGGSADAFPWGTMLVNVSGSLLLGFAVVWL